jgi:hypothetical protein
MTRTIAGQLVRAITICLTSAFSGAFLGGLIVGLSPDETLIFMPFTIFGAVFVLLPAYLWARRSKEWSRPAAYLTLFPTCMMGNLLILGLFFILMGGVTAGAVPVKLLVIGCAVAVITAFSWIIAHHLIVVRMRAISQSMATSV